MAIENFSIGSGLRSVGWLVLVLSLIVGCQALHQEIEPFDDAGIVDDADGCVPGGVCGPCELGEWVCDDDNQRQCEGAVDLDGDPDHCGQCDHQCSTDGVDEATAVCEQGQCEIECDDTEAALCESHSVCADLDSNPNHCGGCGLVCTGSNQCCQEGVCVGSELCE